MYIEHVRLFNLRTFVKEEFGLLYEGRSYATGHSRRKPDQIPQPRLPNVNIVLGDNGSGKSALLRGCALVALGPAVERANLPSYRNVRLEPGGDENPVERAAASLSGQLRLHSQDGGTGSLASGISIERIGDTEDFRFIDPESAESNGNRTGKKSLHYRWDPVFLADSNVFFVMAYGATRRSERKERFDAGARTRFMFARGQRVASLFDDSYSLVPLGAWLNAIASQNPERFQEIVSLIDSILPEQPFRFTGRYLSRDSEFALEADGYSIPFPALSDGYQAFLGWACDLLYHLHSTTPPLQKLTDVTGVVMVDEIDLHLHPEWQRVVVQRIADALPKLQFIFTTHSPLIVSSVEWMNVLHLRLMPGFSTKVERLHDPIHGLDADQILLTDYFGLPSTRSVDVQERLDGLRVRGQSGDRDAAMEYMQLLAVGTEAQE